MKNIFIIIASLFVICGCFAQKSLDLKLKNIDYQHSVSPSPASKMLQSAMGMIGMKKIMEKKMISNNFEKKPAKLTKALLQNFKIKEIEQNGRKVWTISQKQASSDLVILYLHGGAYMANISKEHWKLIEQLLIDTKATIVVPDYPLAPEANCLDVYDFMSVLYSRILIEYPSKKVIFMGDSAGGGLAIGFAQQLRNENKQQPSQIILFSPWLDVTMTNPIVKTIESRDNMLTSNGLKCAGQKYAGSLDLKDYRVSPIFGDFRGLCKISIFTGTNDILNADAQKFKQMINEQRLSYNYFEYPAMFHDWVIFTNLAESKDVINKVSKILNND